MHHLLQSFVLLLQSLEITHLIDGYPGPYLRIILRWTVGDVLLKFKGMEVIKTTLQFCLNF